MPSLPDDRFPLPEDFGPGSVWADRTGHRTLVGRTQRGVEIPIGHGEGEVSPGELLKLALIGCAGMSSDVNLARRLGEDFEARLWAHGTSDEAENRYLSGCTVERSVVPGVEVTHRVLGAEPGEEQA